MVRSKKLQRRSHSPAHSHTPTPTPTKPTTAPPSTQLSSLYSAISPHLLSLALTTSSSLPPTMQKYWRNRHRLFTLFSSGILLDEQSWYSVTPESIAYRIATRCSCTTVVDAFCGAGGNAIQLALTCEKVIAIDIDPNKVQLARHNATIYGVQDSITFCVGDFRDFVRDAIKCKQEGHDDQQKQQETKWQGAERCEIDVVFLSPPWGGVGYVDPTTLPNTPSSSPTKPPASTSTFHTQQQQQTYTDLYSLDLLTPLPGKKLFDLTSNLTGDIAFYLPRNTDLEQIADLLPPSSRRDDQNTIKVEEQCLGSKLSAITCYFGRLATEWDDEKDTWKIDQVVVDGG